MGKKSPIRCFEGNAKPYQPFWNWRAKDSVEGDTTADPELELYGVISEYSWSGDEITPKIFKDDLAKFGKGGPVTVRINSVGGEVIAASVIRSILTDYPGKVTVRIDGLCASAAVMVALAGDVVCMQDSAYMMIHDPGYSMLWGWLDISYLSNLVDQLKAVKNGLLETYEKRTGLSRERLSKMLTDETWMSANEAVKLGFADEIIDGGKPAEKTADMQNLLRNFVNVPPALLNSLRDDQAVEETREAQRLRDEAKLFM